MVDFSDLLSSSQLDPSKVTVIHGVCPKALEQFGDNYFHSLVTDPPAGPVLSQSQGSIGVGNYHSYSGALGTNIPRIGAHKGNVEEHRRARQMFWESVSPVWREVYRVLRPGAFGVVWAHPTTSHWTSISLEDEGFEVRNTLHIDYGTAALRGTSKKHLPKNLVGWNSKVATSTEHWILIRKPPEGTLAANYERWGSGFLNVRACGAGGRVATNTVRFKRVRDKENPHPTSKSVEEMRWLVRLVTPPEGVVLDAFAGSGTTGIAASLEGYHSVIVEAEEKYIHYIKQRLGDA